MASSSRIFVRAMDCQLFVGQCGDRLNASPSDCRISLECAICPGARRCRGDWPHRLHTRPDIEFTDVALASALPSRCATADPRLIAADARCSP